MLTNGIILILASLGLAQGLFLSFYLITLKKGDRKSNVFLALFLLGLTMRVGKSVLNYYITLEPWEGNIGISGVFFAGPFLWFYGIAIIEKNKPFPVRNYLHLIPFVLFVFLSPIIPRNGNFESLWNYGLVVFLLLTYLILSWSNLYKNRLKVSKSILHWYRNILIGATLIWLFYVGNFFDFKIHYITGPIFYTFLIYSFTYLFLNRHKFNLEKYSSSNLDKNSSRKLFQKIKELFEVEHIFLEDSITLDTISEKLKIKAREVSQAINENKQQNFSEFVNHYRIEKAEVLLKDFKYTDEKIATIAYESGFGNVTSFNIAFKKKTGLTPSVYRERQILN
jgi:AraC-like DNA-binding protein